MKNETSDRQGPKEDVDEVVQEHGSPLKISQVRAKFKGFTEQIV